MSRRLKYLYKGFMLILLLDCRISATAKQAEIAPDQLAGVVDRYFRADPNYSPGDLLTREQLVELQMYLRRSRGNTLASHRKWRDYMLPEDAPLAGLFNGQNGEILREAATRGGSYTVLDRLSRTIEGKQRIKAALDHKSSEELVALISEAETAQEKNAANKEDKYLSEKRTLQFRRIYTAEDFVSRVLQSQKKVKSRVSSAASAQPEGVN